jgi:DNA-binding CsgD family transcriptional regulator
MRPLAMDGGGRVSFLSERDLRKILSSITGLSQTPDEDNLVKQALDQLLVLVPGEVSGFNQIDLRAPRVSVDLNPPSPLYVTSSEKLSATIDDHPMIQHMLKTGDYRPCRISDVVSQSRWRASTAFGEVLGPMGTPHMLAIPISIGATGGAGYAVARSGQDFSDRDRDVALLVQSGLVALHHRLPQSAYSDALSDHAGVVALTARELGVLRLVSLGHTAQRIASELGISPRTVRKHLEHVYEKLDVHDRLLAVTRARARGWLP